MGHERRKKGTEGSGSVSANQIQTASREQLLLITYDIGINACKAAEEALRKNEVEAVNENLKRAQAVLRELMITLDVETGGEVAQNLLRLYDFMYYRLVDANVRKDVLLVVAVREMFQELRNTWVEVIEKLKAEELLVKQEEVRTSPVSAVSQSGHQGGVDFAG
jgi:flagellar protein FliS